MRIGPFTFSIQDRFGPGFSPVTLRPRLTQTMTLGGARVSVMPGHISDEPIVLERTIKAYQAVKEEVELYSDAAFGHALATSQRLAVQFAAVDYVSQVILPLAYHVSAAGYLIVELWDDLGGVPLKIGEVGRVQASSLLEDTFQDITVVGDISLPCGPTTQSFLVLSGDNFVGECHWRGEAAQGHARHHFVYDTGAWGAAESGGLDYAVSKGSPFTILRGLCYAYGGGHEWEIDLEDGHLYRGIVVDVQGAFQIHPMGVAESVGYVRDVKLTLMLTEQIA